MEKRWVSQKKKFVGFDTSLATKRERKIEG